MENETNHALITEPLTPDDDIKGQRKVIFGIVLGAVCLLAIIIVGVVFLLNPGTDTGRFRDIFIIFMALESLVIGLVLIILIVQLARLINLLQNEIKPIIASTNETVNTLRGTSRFLSDNMVEPVIKLNEYLAGLQQVFRFVRPKRKD
ncbi:MAG: hypothetical protein IMY76_02740 [Chloroflexi bacterium]|nr:hypothetical protein [Chloroflexota bacterium]